MTKNNNQNQSVTSQYSIPAGQLYPSGITQCQTSTYSQGSDGHYYATSNYPGEMGISGYAFWAQNLSQLTAAFFTIQQQIQQASYSFTSPTIPTG